MTGKSTVTFAKSYALLLAGVILVITGASALLTPTGRRPSLMLVISDDLRYDYMFASNASSNASSSSGSSTNSSYNLRNIQRLMSTGVTFENAFANFASCGPSRQSMLTGRVPDALGVWNQLDHFRQKGSAARSLPEHLISEGYKTISIGKVLHYDTNYGVDEMLSWSETHFGAPSSTDRKCPKGSYFCTCTEPDCADFRIAARAVSLIPSLAEAHFEGTPFFMAIGFRRPHLDWRVPASWTTRAGAAAQFPISDPVRSFPSGVPDIAYFACDKLNHRGEVKTSGGHSETRLVPASLTARMRTAYWTSVAYMDEQLGRVMTALRRNNMEMETIVIFTSDHGYSLGERAFWCKQSLQDVAVRIPFIVSVPWMPNLQGTRSRDTVDLLDLYPTVVSLLNMRQPDKCLQGRDLTPIIESDVPTSISVKDYTIATYPRCAPAGNSTTANNAPINTALTEVTTCAEVGSENIVVMGYSIRTRSFRYTQWRRWIRNIQLADWSAAGIVGVELYDHRLNVDGANPADFENDNLAGTVRFSMIEINLKEQLESLVKSSAYSNKRCGVANVPEPPQGTLCTSAKSVDQCNQLFALRCAWFTGYGCQESSFCGFVTRLPIARNPRTGKTQFGMEEGSPGCNSFASRCTWKLNRCVKRIESALD